jgi:primosomal protein N'
LIPRRYAQIAVEMPFLEPLTYEVPDHLVARTARGCRVLLPFRQGVRVGVVMSLSDTAGELDPAKIRPIADLLDATPVVGEPQLALAEWAAKYYHAPIGEAVRLAVPTSLDVEAERLLDRGIDHAAEERARELARRLSAAPFATAGAHTTVSIIPRDARGVDVTSTPRWSA